MRHLRAIFGTIVVAIVLTTSFLIVLAVVPETVSAYTARDPILIDGDAEFTSANGVTGGSGTASDPYVIEGWEINASSAHGIWIVNTSSHFTVRDCFVHDGGTTLSGLFGIYLLNCTDGDVTGCTSSYNKDGIYLDSSSNITLSDNACIFNHLYGAVLNSSSSITLNGNTFSHNAIGIRLNSSSNNTLRNNGCFDNGYYGILLNQSGKSTLDNNTCSSNFDSGMHLSESTNNSLSNNSCHLNGHFGISLWASSNDNILSKNSCSGNGYGIVLSSSNGNTLVSNDFSDNSDRGIELHASSYNTLCDNTCSSSSAGGIRLIDFSNANTIRNNSCSSASNIHDGISLHTSSGNTLSNNTCYGNDDGIFVMSSSDNILSGNNCSSNADCGIWLTSSSGNIVSNNNASSNGAYGVCLTTSVGTAVYRNTFFDNAIHHAYDVGGSGNSWNARYPVGGNYWDNYTAVDEHSGPDQDQPGPDGIGDTPYEIDTDSVDYYPLMAPPDTPPTASFTVSLQTGDVTTLFSFDASGSWDVDDQSELLEVRWDFDGDGEWDTDWTTDKTATHQYASPGTYDVKLEVRDSDGLTDNATVTVVVVEVIPEFGSVLVPVLSLLLVGAFVAWRRRGREN